MNVSEISFHLFVKLLGNPKLVSDLCGTKSLNAQIMATTKHTPGPWQVRSHGKEDGGYVPIYTEGNLWIAEAMGRGGMKHATVGPNDNNEIAFNAALIAAAPDLLDSCIGMIEYLDKNYPWSLSEPLKSLKSGMVAAIAKATTIELSK